MSWARTHARAPLTADGHKLPVCVCTGPRTNMWQDSSLQAERAPLVVPPHLRLAPGLAQHPDAAALVLWLLCGQLQASSLSPGYRPVSVVQHWQRNASCESKPHRMAAWCAAGRNAIPAGAAVAVQASLSGPSRSLIVPWQVRAVPGTSDAITPAPGLLSDVT